MKTRLLLASLPILLGAPSAFCADNNTGIVDSAYNLVDKHQGLADKSREHYKQAMDQSGILNDERANRNSSDLPPNTPEANRQYNQQQFTRYSQLQTAARERNDAQQNLLNSLVRQRKDLKESGSSTAGVDKQIIHMSQQVKSSRDSANDYGKRAQTFLEQLNPNAAGMVDFGNKYVDHHLVKDSTRSAIQAALDGVDFEPPDVVKPDVKVKPPKVPHGGSHPTKPIVNNCPTVHP